MIYIFDIDGTLADCSHRLHFIQQKPVDWEGFFLACVQDKPILEVIALCRDLSDCGHTILLISGRDNKVKTQTLNWLAYQGVICAELYMRKHGDYREDSIVKGELLDQAIEEFPGKIFGVFEDRRQVVDMYRARGLRVFQVAEGNF